MEERIKNKLRIKFGIDNDYENYRGVHYYEDITISNILLDEVTGKFTVHFDRVLKTVTDTNMAMTWAHGMTKSKEHLWLQHLTKNLKFCLLPNMRRANVLFALFCAEISTL